MSEMEIHPLRKVRIEFNLSREDVAVATLLSSSTIKRAEANKGLNDDVIARLCEYVSQQYHREVTPEELGLKRRRRSKSTSNRGWLADEKEPETIEEEQQKIASLSYLDNISQKSVPLSAGNRSQFDSPVILLPKELIPVLVKLLSGESIMGFDPIRRKLLEYLIVSASIADTASIQNLLDWEFWDRFSQTTTQPASLDEKTLAKFESITANCWQLLKVDGLSIVEQLLPTYLPQIVAFTQHSSKYQERVAYIASQGYILAGLVAVLQSKPTESERCCKQAVLYAQMAKNRDLEVAALKHLATKYLDNNASVKMLQTYQRALPFLQEVSPLLQGRTYLGLALALARNGQEKDAYYNLKLAYDTFPDCPEADLAYSYADCNLSSLNHYAGLVYMELEKYEKAQDTFAQVEYLSAKTTIPERTFIEINNCRAEASLALRDIKKAHDLIAIGIKGANRLQSQMRYNESLALYRQARLLWPKDRQIRELAALFQR